MKKLVQVIALLLLISAPVSATGVATWTLQGVASYAQALVAAIETGSTTVSASAGWLSGNATDQYSIPIWDSTTNTWTARPMLPMGISAATSKQPLSISASGTLRYLVPGGEPVPVLPNFATPSYQFLFNLAVMPATSASGIVVSTQDYPAQDTYIRHAFDNDESTHAKLVSYLDFSGPETYNAPEIYVEADQPPHGGNFYGWTVNGYSFLVASTTTSGISSWTLLAYNLASSAWVVADSVVASSTIEAGHRYTSTAQFTYQAGPTGVTNYPNFRIVFGPASGEYVDIAEFDLLQNPASTARWIDCPPPATFSAQAITFSPSSSVPTATGSVYADAGGALHVRDQHGASSTVLTSYPTWQDLRVSLLSTNAGGTNAPTPTLVRANGTNQGVFAYSFDKTTEQELYTSVQLPHGIVKDHVHPHLHWMPSDTSGSGTTHIVWAIEYALTNIGSVVATPTIAYAPATATGIINKHMLIEFPAVDISGAKDSAVMLIRVYRAAGLATDDYNAPAFATDFDLHHQMPNSAAGSLLEYGDN